MPKHQRPWTLTHPDFPPVDWKPIAGRFGIFFIDTTRVDPENPFSKNYSAPNVPPLMIPCIHDLPKWEYPYATAGQLAVIEFKLAQYDRYQAMQRAGLNPKPVFKSRGFKFCGAINMMRGRIDKYYEWKAARERDAEFPDAVAAERSGTKSKVLVTV